jgi:hypothetical protein
MDRAQLHRLDINLLLAFDALISERNVTKAAQLGEFGGEIEHADVRLPVRLPYPTRASRTGFGPPPVIVHRCDVISDDLMACGVKVSDHYCQVLRATGWARMVS